MKPVAKVRPALLVLLAVLAVVAAITGVIFYMGAQQAGCRFEEMEITSNLGSVRVAVTSKMVEGELPQQDAERILDSISETSDKLDAWRDDLSDRQARREVKRSVRSLNLDLEYIGMGPVYEFD